MGWLVVQRRTLGIEGIQTQETAVLSVEVCVTAAYWLQLGQWIGWETSAVVMAVLERWEKFPPSWRDV